MRAFHEVITQPEPNGKYLRTLLKENFPRHWSLMSNRLYNMGYNFREMSEYDARSVLPTADNKFDNTKF